MGACWAIWALAVGGLARAEITNGLVAYYPFNGNANDASGNGNDGTPVGSLTFTNTPFGSGLDFPGPAVAHLDLGTWLAYTNFTIGLWVYPRVTEPGAVLLDDNSNGSTNWACQSLDGTNYNFGGASFTLPAQTWSYLVLAAAPTGLEVYVNGQFAARQPGTVIRYLNPTRCWVGAGVAAAAGTPTAWDGIVANLRIYRRVLSTNEVAQLTIDEAASNHSAFVWSQLCPSNQVPAQFNPTAASVDSANGIVYSARRSGELMAYNLASNTFTNLPASNGPGGALTAVYDSTHQRLLSWAGGRGTVFAISATGGVWQTLGGGATSGSDYSNFTWWNPVTARINTFGGYGGHAYRNWLWDFNPTNGVWTQLQTNQPGAAGLPWPRIGINSIAPDPAGTRLFLWGGNGNSNGVQYTIDPGFASWDDDLALNGPSSELLQDLWQFNYAANSWSNIVPVRSPAPYLQGPIVYHPATTSLLLLGGQYPPALSQIYTSLVYQLRFGIDSYFTPLNVIGTPPATLRRKNFFPVAVGDAPRQRAVLITDDGIHALTVSSQAAATIRVVASTASGGTVHGSGTYPVGSVQTISAVATSNWSFISWSDANTNATRALTIPLGGATYRATFQQQTAVLTVQASPTDGGATIGSGTNSAGSWVYIAAYASNGWQFVNWSDNATNTTAVRLIKVPTTNYTFTANFTNCACALTGASATVPASAGSGQMVVTTSTGCVWTALSNTNWLQTSSHGMVSGSISYTYDANPDGVARVGTITVPGQSLTITQAAATCTYALSAAGTNVSAGANGGSLGVITPTGCSWTATVNTNWVRITSSGVGGDPLNYTYDVNLGSSSRSAVITVQGLTYTIRQAAGNCTYALSASFTNVAVTAGSGYLRVSAPSGCPWGAVSSSPDWLHSTSTGAGDGILNYSFDANSANCSSRSGSFTVGGQVFTLIQAAGSGSYGLLTVRTNVAANAGSGTIGVTAGVGCGWNASSTTNWIQTTSVGTGSGSIRFTFDANLSGVMRSSTIVLTDKVFTVVQAAVTCTSALAATSADFTANATTGTVGVLAPAGCFWTAMSNVGWVNITSNQSGSGSATVIFAVADNTVNCNDRSGTLSIGGQTFTVTQATGSGAYLLSSTSTSVTAQAGSCTVELAAGTGCDWNAMSDSSWIHTISFGTGSGFIHFSYDSNPIATNRTGTITAGSQTLRVTQWATTAPLTVSINPTNSGTGTGSGTYPVGTNVQISASAATNWTFTGWSDGVTNLLRTVPVVDGGSAYTANFSQDPTLTARLTVQANPSLGGTVSGGGTYAVGNQQQISASAKTGWEFTDWADGVSNSLRTITLLAGGASYTANFAVVFSGTVPVLITPPVITNSLLVIGQQFLVAVGETNVFSVGAADPVDNARLRYQWIFGDGGTSDWSAAAVATHVYSTNNCGRYAASVTVSNGLAAVRSNLLVSAACQLTITRLQLGLNFAKTNADNCTLIAKLDPAGITNVTQLTTVLVDVNDAVVPFTLNSQGRGSSTNGSCRLVYTKPTKTKLGYWTLTAALSQGNWYSQWVGAGLTNATIKPAVPVNLMVGVELGSDAFAADQPLNYTATHNRTGTAK